MDDGSIDYSTYSRAELLSALRAVDKAAYPRNHANLMAALGPLEPGELAPEPPRLTWRRLLGEGLEEITRSPRTFARLLGVPGLLMLLLAPWARTEGEWQLLANAPWLVLLLFLAFRVHRFILTPGTTAPALRTYLGFLTWSLVLVGTTGTWAALLWVLREVTGALLLVFSALPVIVYAGARASLILPDRAIDGTAPLREVWAWSAGRGWWLVALLAMPGLAGELVAALISLLIGDARFASSVDGVLAVATSLYGVAVLTCAYRALSRGRADHLSVRGDAGVAEHA